MADNRFNRPHPNEEWNYQGTNKACPGKRKHRMQAAMEAHAPATGI